MSLMLSCLPGALAFGACTDDDAPASAESKRSADRSSMSQLASSPPPDERAETDARLLRRMAASDRAALAELYDRFSRPLYATALRIVSDRAEAQDLVHDAFLSLWHNAAEFDPAR